jgi:HSP20 family protein
MKIVIILNARSRQPIWKEEDIMAYWDMFRELDTLRREIDDAFRGVGLRRVLTPHFLTGGGTQRFPLVNISEDPTDIHVAALLPGVDPSQVEVSVLRNTLTLSGERNPLETDKNLIWHRNERGAGKFSRTIELPAEIDNAKVSAQCKDGVLTVLLPKVEAAKPKKITVGIS